MGKKLYRHWITLIDSDLIMYISTTTQYHTVNDIYTYIHIYIYHPITIYHLYNIDIVSNHSIKQTIVITIKISYISTTYLSSIGKVEVPQLDGFTRPPRSPPAALRAAPWRPCWHRRRRQRQGHWLCWMRYSMVIYMCIYI